MKYSGAILNPFSICSQCANSTDVGELLAAIVGCLDFLLPAIEADRCKVFYDWRIENRRLVPNEDLRSSISYVRGTREDGGDLIRKWYLYTQNRAELLAGHDEEFTVICPASTFLPVTEVADEGCAREASLWLSFDRCPIGRAPALHIAKPIQAEVANAHSRKCLEGLLPRYEPSPKHRAEPYYDAIRQEHVAGMPLNREEAQALLLASVLHESDYFGFHKASGNIIRFKPTLGNEYHAFAIGLDELPVAARERLGI